MITPGSQRVNVQNGHGAREEKLLATVVQHLLCNLIVMADALG